MAEDSITFEQAKEEQNKRENEEGHPTDSLSQQEWHEEVTFESLKERFGDVKSFLKTLPDDINVGEGQDIPGTLPPNQREEIVAELDLSGVGNIQQLLASISGDLSNISGDLSGLNQRQLLEFQARALRALVTLSIQQSQIQINQLQAQFDTLTAVEPIISITVSGRNSIDQAGAPQVVVPRSQNADVPTRKLLVKASSGNNQSIAFGDDEVDPQNGFVLESGQNIMLPIDLRKQKLYMASSEVGATVELLGVV